MANIFTRLAVFEPKGSSDTFNSLKNVSVYVKRGHLIIIHFSASGTKVSNPKRKRFFLTVLTLVFSHIYFSFSSKF